MLSPEMLAATGPTGAMGQNQVEALSKALSAGYGTDVATLSGGGALRVQSLDHTMQATIQENKHFRLFNKLPKPKAGATVDEWTEMSSVGGFLGGSTNSESGAISNATGQYNRRVGLVKYLMTQRQVTLVQTLQGAIADSEAIEYSNGAKQLLTDAEYLAFEGDSTVVPTEFDGIYAQMVAGVAAGQVDTANIVDAHGQSLASVSVLSDAAATVSAYGNFGTPTDLFFSQLVQSDFDKNLDPAYRVPLTDNFSSVQIGSPVRGIRTSWGDIATNPDVFVRDDKMKQPFELYQPVIAATNAGQKPSAVAGTTALDAASYFQASMAGNYYYYVTGVTASGQSTGTISAQVAVAAGQSVSLLITQSALGQETGYVVYRSRLNGGAVLAGSIAGQGSDFREMCRVAKAGPTTTYVDQNRDIPGASKGFLLNMTPGDTAINWRQLLPMMKFPLYPTQAAVIPWAQLLFGYLRISKRRHHAVIKNIVPNGQTWRPFNV